MEQNNQKVYVMFELVNGHKNPVFASEKRSLADNAAMDSRYYACVEKHDPVSFVEKYFFSKENVLASWFDPVRFTVRVDTDFAKSEIDLGNMKESHCGWGRGCFWTEWA